MPRILEEDLHLPALYLINLKSGEITTTELSNLLRDILNPKDEDLDILDGRNDDKFSQIVRNLTATERSFVRNGYIERETGRNKPLFITEKGKNFLNKNYEFVKYLFSNDFNFKDMIDSFKSINSPQYSTKQISFIDENIIITEGRNKVVETKAYQRSSKLRNLAIEYYTLNGRIKCKACCFDFEEFYGDYGKGFIEIHHQKPVFMFDESELEKTIENALENVIPICPNCHRMIHKTRAVPLTFDEIKEHVRRDLDFCDE
ncbi:MAG: HNH endonuclease [Sulfuricurvum sp.]|nr:HNH endonuclease [Sulfuricurvum sp.]